MTRIAAISLWEPDVWLALVYVRSGSRARLALLVAGSWPYVLAELREQLGGELVGQRGRLSPNASGHPTENEGEIDPVLGADSEQGEQILHAERALARESRDLGLVDPDLQSDGFLGESDPA